MSDDYFIATGALENFDGGDDIDTVDYSNSDAGVNINLLLSLFSGGFAAGDTLTSIENVIGSNFNDVLRGDGNANLLQGEGGRDVLEGDAGADYLDGGEGWDYARYRASEEGVTVNLTTNVNTGGDAQGDTLISIEAVMGSYFNDTITGNASANYLRGEIGDDTLHGEGDNDVLSGAAGADFLDGGLGNDTADYNDSVSGVTINLLNNVATGGDAAGDTFLSVENITGSNFADNIRGDNNANILKGLDGRDVLEGGAGADTLDGGDGWDYARYRASKSGVTVNLETNINTGGDAQSDTLISIEAVTGSYFNDSLTGDGNNNYLRGELGDDSLYGGEGDDDLSGGVGSDLLDGGLGNDTANYNDSALAVNIDLQNATASGGDAAGDTLISIENLVGSNTASERDFLYGDAGDNKLYGLAGKDILEGGVGADTLDGGDGWDYARYIRSDAAVTINLETGVNTGGHAAGDTLISIEAIIGSAYNDKITGGAGNDYLKGENGDDTLKGGTGHDEIYGGIGADTLEGNDGNDILYGGADNDSLKGGIGTDTFVFVSIADGVDTVQDFKLSANDKLDISDLLSGYDALSDAISDFVQITDNGTDSFLSVDIDGGADNFVQIATLLGIIGLTDEDALETSGNLITA